LSPRRPDSGPGIDGQFCTETNGEGRGARGSADAPPVARASYAALLAAEIARHKAYPEAARAAGVTGSVGVALTAGPWGRIVSHAITRSSGYVALHREVDATMAEVQAPPPPGGIFRAGLTIHFGFE
jgi:periplasmic protein TonB